MEAVSQNVDWGALNWAAIAAVTIFFASQAISLVSAEISRRRTRKMLARALHAEILALFNVVLGQSESDIRLLERIELEEIAGVIVPSEEPKVYNANVGMISAFPKQLVMDIVSLYTASASINSITENIKRDTFKLTPKEYKVMGKEVFFDKLVEHNKLVKRVVAQLEKYNA